MSNLGLWPDNLNDWFVGESDWMAYDRFIFLNSLYALWCMLCMLCEEGLYLSPVFDKTVWVLRCCDHVFSFCFEHWWIVDGIYDRVSRVFSKHIMCLGFFFNASIFCGTRGILLEFVLDIRVEYVGTLPMSKHSRVRKKGTRALFQCLHAYCVFYTLHNCTCRTSNKLVNKRSFSQKIICFTLLLL